eukprot:TRINITY_DN9417_c0_g1_i2.p1 TRINITY_DN9417_c0_g1~~TRINITY_DN9417_c0_g1_i2.p1  ORF type:complete len:532 (-),score=60.78 TRINITY_DN9417_c0_g1_i2:86-1681(-)
MLSLWACLLLFCSLGRPERVSFVFDSFDDTSAVVLPFYDVSDISEGIVTIVSANTFSLGRMFYKDPIRLSTKGSFSTFFGFVITESGGIRDQNMTWDAVSDTAFGGEGFVFMLASEFAALGESSQSGVGGSLGYFGLNHSIAIEFDTYNNDNNFTLDPNGNHVGIDLNGAVKSVATFRYPEILNDGNVRYAWIDYDGESQILEVRVNESIERPANAILSYSLTNFLEMIGGANVIAGFSASTGGATGRHCITKWRFVNQYEPNWNPSCGDGLVEGSETCDGGTCCNLDCTLDKDCDAESSNSDKAVIIALSVVAVISVGGLAAAGFLFFRRWKKAAGETDIESENTSALLLHMADMKLGGRIGSGSCGVVYRGRLGDLDVAIKVLTDSRGILLDNFVKEATTMGSVAEHEHVVKFIGVTLPPDQFAIVTKFYSGGSLDAMLTSPRSISESQKERWAREIALGMHHLHASSVVHRDLAARNILLKEDLTAVVSDFGLARAISSDAEYGKTANSFGPIKWALKRGRQFSWSHP